jgi:formyltetrahydrofolate deformylase
MPHRLLITCPDTPGIVAAVSGYLYRHGANIVHSDQHTGHAAPRRFFLRVEWEGPRPEEMSYFGVLAAQYGMEWRMIAEGRRPKLALFCGRETHCLQEILWQMRVGDIEASAAVIVSNHRLAEPIATEFGVPFVPTAGKSDEDTQLESVELADAVVLARYMQILSGDFLRRVGRPVINIHHSFLPAFQGANPYRQAFERGVKRIGATAHYVTEELDAGPIIEQDTAPVDHRCTIADLRSRGRHLERMVLARAVKWHCEDRVLLDGSRTVVFA